MGRRQTQDLLHGELTSSIIGAMYEGFQELGYGFREYIYALALEQVLVAKGHRVRRTSAVKQGRIESFSRIV